MEVKAHCKQVERRIVRKGGSRKNESGRIHVPADWVDEEVLVLRLGNPPHIVAEGKTAIESTLDEDGYTVVVLNAHAMKPTRLAIHRDTLEDLLRRLRVKG